MNSIKSKILNTFQNLRSDAAPRSPRPVTPNFADGVEDGASEDGPTIEEVHEESDKDKKKFKQKKFKPFFKPEKKHNPDGKSGRSPPETAINTQATGDVTHIVNSRSVHGGDHIVYNFGTPSTEHKDTDSFDESIKKDNLITLLMEVKTPPDHECRDYVSKNLGKNWHSFFRTLGFTKGYIETVEIDEARNGVSEARYKLLLEWTRNDDDGSLGRLAARLWDAGERQIVRELSLLHKRDKA